MEGDPIGLQLGTPDRPVKKVLVALDVTEDVADEAIRLQADMIVAHHAVIYRPVRHLRTDLPAGKLYAKLLTHDIAVYVAHTNREAAEGGVGGALASGRGLTEAVAGADRKHGQLAKLAVVVPKGRHDRVMQAVYDAGAGWIGNGSHCSFNVEGTGTFLAGEG